jgi:uncharacterized protein (TIGR02680 family)
VTETLATLDEEFAPAQPKHHPHRWRLARAGIVNVWHYYDSEFAFTGGRMILRGTNGAGKSRALEMLLPYLLDADRRKMDATGSGKVRLEDLMRHGAQGQTNRLGYLWLELTRDTDDEQPEFLTVGALVRFSASTGEAKPWYFTTDKRVGIDLPLMDDRRQPLSRDQLGELIGVDLITDKPDIHRDRIGSVVFGLTGQSGRERYAGLLQLLHTLRAPDMGNRIDEGNLPKILSDALPPLSETTLREAGERLDSLKDSREEQRRLMVAVEQVDGLLDVYRRYVAKALYDTAETTREISAEAMRLTRAADVAKAEHQKLRYSHNETQEKLAEAREKNDVLGARIEGIKESELYRAGLDMENLGRNVRSLERGAETALTAAGHRRADEARTVERADGQAREIETLGRRAAAVLVDARSSLRKACLPVGALPADVTVTVDPGEPTDELVRQSLHEPPDLVARPAPQRVAVVPEDLEELAHTVHDVGGMAHRRESEARSRLDTARDLVQRETSIAQAEALAEELALKAEDDAERAEGAADDRDGEARALATKWRQWTGDERTREVLGDVDWSGTSAGALLLDAGTLTGVPGDSEDLRRLDAVAEEAAGPARQTVSDQRAAIRHNQELDDQERKKLKDERADLLAERDPEPPNAPWARGGPDGSEPLWRTVDFADQVAQSERAGLEAALMASGLLSASVTDDGTVRAEDGQVLLSTASPVAARSAREVLSWDSASGIAEHVVTEILARIGIGDGHGTWIGLDGRWGTGPLHGKYRTDRARFIGATARAAARAERLEQIAKELATLDGRDTHRRDEREQLVALETELRSFLRTAPDSTRLREARATAKATAETANRSQGAAGKALAAAIQMRAELTADRKAHDDQCARLGLPVDVAGLDEVERAATDAKRLCQQLVDHVTGLRRGLTTHERMTTEARSVAGERGTAEERAERAWSEWHLETEKLSALEDAVGKDLEEIRGELREAEKQQEQVRGQTAILDTAERDLDRKSVSAEAAAKHANGEAVRGARESAEQHAVLMSQVAVPGVLDAATRGRLGTAEELGADGATIAAQRVQQAVDRGGAAVGENALMRAVQSVSNELTNTLDLDTTKEAGVWLVELIDATGRHPVAVAAANLREQADRAAEALTTREQKVFTDFVVGGVGEELRRRLSQAGLLVKAMNASLAGIRTSHGIGVRLRWELTEPKGSPIARIRELVKASSAVRPVEEMEELIRLLKERVDEQFALDADAGYSTHLSTALDYRQWHRVEVFILGPAPNQERKISRRAKLSQGETRFVSYVALFAAADAYLSGLPDTGVALRLILLDDAFAKVDDRTIGELMGLLVRLDLDFCMTGHALWGTYGQVPSVDVYEIRRAEGTAAVATHVHWDGRTRHYLRSTAH